MNLGERKSPSSASGNLIPYVELLSDARTPHGKRRVSAHQGWEGEKSHFFSILIRIISCLLREEKSEDFSVTEQWPKPEMSKQGLILVIS